MKKETSPVADLWLGAFILAICAATIWEVADLPAGTFEPLGSGPVPRWTAGIIICLTLWVMFKAWNRLRGGWRPSAPDISPRWADMLMVCAFTIVYALSLHFRVARFDLLTTAYLFFTIGLLVHFRIRSLAAVAIVSTVVGFGSYIVFTKVFVVDLPGAF